MNTDDTDQQNENAARITSMRAALTAFRNRKEMYLSEVTCDVAENFLYGFDLGCLACGIRLEWQRYIEKRGWSFDGDLVRQMRDRGYPRNK